MKASKFTEAQKAFILKQGEAGTPVAGISQATYFNWKKRYGGLLPDEMRRLKALEDENGRLKKIVADVPGHGYETARCAGYAAILVPVAASVSRAFCSALI